MSKIATLANTEEIKFRGIRYNLNLMMDTNRLVKHMDQNIKQNDKISWMKQYDVLLDIVIEALCYHYPPKTASAGGL